MATFRGGMPSASSKRVTSAVSRWIVGGDNVATSDARIETFDPDAIAPSSTWDESPARLERFAAVDIPASIGADVIVDQKIVENAAGFRTRFVVSVANVMVDPLR